MSTRVRRFDLAKSTPKFEAQTEEEDSNLRQRINVLTTLATAFLQAVEDLQSAVTKTATNRPRTARAFGSCASMQCDNPIDFYKEVERYEIDLIKKMLRHTAGNQRRAAKLLNLNATTLNGKLKNYGIIDWDWLRSGRTFGVRHPTTRAINNPQGAQALTTSARRKAPASGGSSLP